MVKSHFSHVRHWVFDLDNTLYPPSARLFDQIEVKMTDYVMAELGVDHAEADRLRKHYWREHGTTLAGLMQEHGIDPDPYLVAVHDISFAPLDPDAELAAFKAPTRKEREHDFLWRVHHCTPACGHVSIFNRSHYEDVLIVRVEDLVPKAVWSQRYEIINSFERNLKASGTTILKFYLHISKEEQLSRFQKRLENPQKHWKLNVADYTVRERWQEYREASLPTVQDDDKSRRLSPHNLLE